MSSPSITAPSATSCAASPTRRLQGDGRAGDATAEDILRHKPDGVFLSNGPGDPAATGEYAVPVIQGVLIASGKPMFGICLGHQLLALALGGTDREDGDQGMPKRTDIKTILIIGAGPIVIGQACEFDYSGAQACKALRPRAIGSSWSIPTRPRS
jgi:hypothetical protein